MRNCTLLVLLFWSNLFCSPAQAGLFSDAWGILTDPFKIGAGTDNIMHTAERTMIHLERLQNQLGQDADRVLSKVDQIVGDTRKDMFKLVALTGSEAKAVTNNAFNRVSELQRDVFRDASQLVKCSTVVTLEQVQTSMAKSLNELGERKPRIEIFGWTILSAKIDPIDIKNPMETFRAIKAIYQQRLNDVTPDDRYNKITDIYGEMQRLSDLARCHYKNDTGLFEELYWTELEFNRKERAWRNQVNL